MQWTTSLAAISRAQDVDKMYLFSCGEKLVAFVFNAAKLIAGAQAITQNMEKMAREFKRKRLH